MNILVQHTVVYILVKLVKVLVLVMYKCICKAIVKSLEDSHETSALSNSACIAHAIYFCSWYFLQFWNNFNPFSSQSNRFYHATYFSKILVHVIDISRNIGSRNLFYFHCCFFLCLPNMLVIDVHFLSFLFPFWPWKLTETLGICRLLGLTSFQLSKATNSGLTKAENHHHPGSIAGSISIQQQPNHLFGSKHSTKLGCGSLCSINGLVFQIVLRWRIDEHNNCGYGHWNGQKAPAQDGSGLFYQRFRRKWKEGLIFGNASRW